MYREPTVKGRKPGLKSIVWTRRKKETFNQNRTKKQVEERLRNLWDNFKYSNIQIIGVPEEKRKTTKLKAYLKT